MADPLRSSSPVRPRADLALFLVGVGIVAWCLWGGDAPGGSVARAQAAEGAAEPAVVGYGAWSLVPAVVALLLAYITKQVVLSLFVGVICGSLVIGAHTAGALGWGAAETWADLNFLDRFLLPALGTQGYAKILLVYLWFLGGILGIWAKTGGARHFAETVGVHLSKGPRTARVFAWVIGCVFHQGGTVSTVLAGTTVKPVADRHRVSHEELAYIVDSTASPIATVLPFNAWPAYIGTLVAGATAASLDGFVLIPEASDGVSWFFRSIPYNFYGVFAVLLTLLFSLDLLPWVGKRMRAAQRRARETGQLDHPDARPILQSGDIATPATDYPVSLVDFLVPLGMLLGVAIVPFVLFDADLINEAFLLCTLSAMGVATWKGMPLRDVLDGFVDGCKGMTVGAIILGLAVTLGAVSRDLKTADFLISVVDGMPPLVLPVTLTVVCMIVAFSIGSSWGTYAVIFPIAVPLALRLGLDQAGAPADLAIAQLATEAPEVWESALFYVSVCFGAVIGGAVFGDQCSPISDTTILSSMFCGCDLMDHVRTQLPLSLVAAAVGALLSTLLVLLV